ncbi:hypothetical protein ARNL5_02486 [Anaerolineae bacterium]|nr:hypothetical protein ARNL5_02486 [Anaerolineae bacterium]
MKAVRACLHSDFTNLCLVRETYLQLWNHRARDICLLTANYSSLATEPRNCLIRFIAVSAGRNTILYGETFKRRLSKQLNQEISMKKHMKTKM